MGPQHELVLSIILGVSLCTTPSGASSRPLPLLPQRSHQELGGISQVVQTSPIHLTIEETGAQRGIGACPEPHNPPITGLRLELKIPNTYLKLQQEGCCITSAF